MKTDWIEFLRDKPDSELHWLVDAVEDRWGLRALVRAAADILIVRTEFMSHHELNPWDGVVESLIKTSEALPERKLRTSMVICSKGGAK